MYTPRYGVHIIFLSECIEIWNNPWEISIIHGFSIQKELFPMLQAVLNEKDKLVKQIKKTFMVVFK